MDTAKPWDFKPMQPRPQPQPFSHDDWLAELKFDGYRVLASTTAAGAALRTRDGTDCTRWFPEVVAAMSDLPAGHVFDGEMCVLDTMGRCHFDRLHARVLRGAWSPGCDPVVFCVFDHLQEGQHDLRHWPLIERKERLKKALAGSLPELLLVEGLPGDGHWLWRKAQEMRFEGIVLKRLDSVYRSGVVSGDWVSVTRPDAASARRHAARRELQKQSQ